MKGFGVDIESSENVFEQLNEYAKYEKIQY